MYDIPDQFLTLASQLDVPPAQRERLSDFLSRFVTERRRQRIADVLAQRTRYLTVVLENLSKPHNASAIIRSCDSFGVQDLHIIDTQRQFKFKRTATSGAHQWVTHHFYRQPEHQANLDDCFGRLRAAGYRLAAASPSPDALPLHAVDLSSKLALIFGTELHGLSAAAEAHADVLLRVPQVGFSESLNVSVAAAVCLADLSSRLRLSEQPWQLAEETQSLLRLQWLANSVDQPDKLIGHFLNNVD